MSRLTERSVFSALLVFSLVCSAADIRPGEGSVTIRLYCDVRLSDLVLGQAEQDASRIFQQAGIETIWITCQPSRLAVDSACHVPPGPRSLVIRIVPKALTAPDYTFGMAFIADGRGTYSDVFYNSVEKLHKDYGTSVSHVLGHVMAHEVGHLLLGSNSHAEIGIMKPRWYGEQLRAVEEGTLFFTRDQARLMRTRLSAE